MLDVPPGYQPRAEVLGGLLRRLVESPVYQGAVNARRGPGDITLALSRMSNAMHGRLDWALGDSIVAHQLVAADMALMDLFMVDEEAVAEREILARRPELLARMPHHAMQSLVFGVPRADAFIVYLCETRYLDGRERCITMWGILHPEDLVPHNLGDPLMHPYFHYMEYFHEEIISMIARERFRPTTEGQKKKDEG